MGCGLSGGTGALALGKNRFEGSLAWLVKMEALTQAQADSLTDIREHRHEIAHELARLLVDPDAEVSADKLGDLYGISRSLDRLWGEYEVNIDSDFDCVDVDYDGVRSGTGALLEYLAQLAGVDVSRMPGETPAG
jgi:hypothetical protein